MKTPQLPFEIPDPTIKLNPIDWYRATWRKLPPLRRPQPRPFSWDDIERRYFRAGYFVWGRMNHLSPSVGEGDLSWEEAHFWMRVLAHTVKERPQDRIPELSFAAAQQPVPFEEAQTKLTKLTAFRLTDSVINILLSAYSYMGAIELVCLTAADYRGDGFHQRLLPYITQTERQQLQTIVRQYLAEQQILEMTTTQQLNRHMPVTIWLTSVLGMSAEMNEVLSNWGGVRSFQYSTASGQPQAWLMGAEDPDWLVKQLNQSAWYLEEPYELRGWLAHTCDGHHPFILESLRRPLPHNSLRRLLDVFALVETPETATKLVELFNDQPTRMLQAERGIIRPWLQARPEMALKGLASLVNLQDGVGSAARDHVQWLVNQDSQLLPTFEQLAEETSWRPEQITHTSYDPDHPPTWWRDALMEQPLPSITLPDWLIAQELPVLMFGDGLSLHKTQVETLLKGMRQSAYKRPHPLIMAVKEAAEADSLIRFAVKLLTLWWRYHDEWQNTRWMLNVLLWWHSDALPVAVMPLFTEMVQRPPKQWQERLNPDSFKYILSLWEQVPTNAVLRALGRLQRLEKLVISYETIQKVIDSCMRQRGLDRSQLHDLMIPTFGLDEHSERRFTSGEEEVVLALDEDLKSYVEWRGQRYAGVPGMVVLERTLLIQQVSAIWESMRDELPKVLENELWRLERALVYERRWKWEEFVALFLHHPIMRHIGRSIIWGRYMFNGQLTHSFVLMEDGVPLSAEYDEVELPGYGYYGLVHPIDLTSDERLTWYEMLTDYEIVTIFDQLFRPVYTLTAEERNSPLLTRFDGLFNPEMSFTLRSLHWKPLDGGLRTWRRFFPYSNVSALLTLRTVKQPDGSSLQMFEGCRFTQGKVQLEGLPKVSHVSQLPLQWLLPRRVRPRVVSEVLWDWERVVEGSGQ